MTAQRLEDILLDHEAVSRALKAPRAPHFESGMRPKYRLEDRLPAAGPRASVAPPSARVLAAMSLAPPAKHESNRSLVLAMVLLVLTAVTGMVVYRDMHRTPAATAPTSAE